MTGKNNKSEFNPSPIPVSIRKEILNSGLLICLYYDGVPHPGRETPEPRPRTFRYMVITQMIAGRGIYWNPQVGSCEVKPGQWIVGTQKMANSYFGYKGSFTEDSIAFYGPAVTALEEAGVIRNGLFTYSGDRLLLPIIQKLREATTISILEANSMLINLIFDMYHVTGQAGDNSLRPAFDNLIREMKRDMSHWWTVSEMADFCNISENYLRRMFHKYLGVAPKIYLDNLRMNRAAELLSGTELSIGQIAEQLGYVDTYHFIRRFSQLMAIPPARYRKNFVNRLHMHPVPALVPIEEKDPCE